MKFLKVYRDNCAKVASETTVKVSLVSVKALKPVKLFHFHFETVEAIETFILVSYGFNGFNPGKSRLKPKPKGETS